MELDVQITSNNSMSIYMDKMDEQLFNVLISRIAFFRAHKGATQMSRTQHTFNLFEALPSLHDFRRIFPNWVAGYPAQISRTFIQVYRSWVGRSIQKKNANWID